MTDAMGLREGSKIEASLKLMRLDANKRKQRRPVRISQDVQIIEIGAHVFVDRDGLYTDIANRLRRHTFHIGNGAVGHESAAESFDVTCSPVLAGFQDHDSKCVHGAHKSDISLMIDYEAMLHEYKGKLPKLGDRVFIAEGAEIVGDVEIGDHSSIWFNCVIRGDVHFIRIGKHTNIQDGSVAHGMLNQYSVIVGDYVTVGHGVMMHGCTIESHCLIGMRATILNNVTIGANSIVGAAALITENTIVPPRSLVIGMPAKVKRQLSDEEVASIDEYAKRYYNYKESYLTAKK